MSNITTTATASEIQKLNEDIHHSIRIALRDRVTDDWKRRKTPYFRDTLKKGIHALRTIKNSYQLFSKNF